jgi:hypothetical protein
VKTTDTDRESPLAEAARRGEEYTASCGACAPAVFTAIMETLGYGGDPMMREVCKASIGLTGGLGCMSVGTCGAVAAASLAMSLSFGFSREDIEGDMAKMFAVNTAVAELGKRVQERFGHIQCQEIQFSQWGKSFRFTNPDALAEFVAFSQDERSGFKCNRLAGTVSAWTVESIMKINPGFSRRKVS